MRWHPAALLLFLVPTTSCACSYTKLVYPWSPRIAYPDELTVDRPIPRLIVGSSLTFRPDVPAPPGEIDVPGCDGGAADFDVKVKIANLEPDRLRRFGYKFMVKSANGRHVDVEPFLVGAHRIEGDSAVFDIEVGDFSRDELHDAIDVEMEVFAVNASLRRGKSTTFSLHADARAPRPPSPKSRLVPRVRVLNYQEL